LYPQSARIKYVLKSRCVGILSWFGFTPSAGNTGSPKNGLSQAQTNAKLSKSDYAVVRRPSYPMSGHEKLAASSLDYLAPGRPPKGSSQTLRAATAYPPTKSPLSPRIQHIRTHDRSSSGFHPGAAGPWDLSPWDGIYDGNSDQTLSTGML
jgi:hypothetical protein